jgi:hypothetical protein
MSQRPRARSARRFESVPPCEHRRCGCADRLSADLFPQPGRAAVAAAPIEPPSSLGELAFPPELSAQSPRGGDPA